MNTMVQQVIELTRPRWRDIPQERGVTIAMKTELAAALPWTLGVESEIREALINLIINAVDALPYGGTIMVSTKWESQKSKEPNTPTHLLVEIADGGLGMDEEAKARCLEPFYSTKGELGTGLGLAMVYGVMQRHGGDIEIDSELGRGTSIRLIFPIKAGRLMTPAHTPERERARPMGLRILAIDDEQTLRELVKEILISDGHQVELCDGGQAGIEAFRTAKEQGEPFDIVITDLGLPYIDGRQVARTVKRESPQTPVILLTGWGTRLHAEGNIPKEVDIVLSKPPKNRRAAPGAGCVGRSMRLESEPDLTGIHNSLLLARPRVLARPLSRRRCHGVGP